MGSSLYIKLNAVSVVSGQTWHMRKPMNLMPRQNSSLASVSSPAAMEKYLQALPVLTTLSGQTKVMVSWTPNTVKTPQEPRNKGGRKCNI